MAQRSFDRRQFVRLGATAAASTAFGLAGCSSAQEGAEGETHSAAPNANWLEGRRFDAGTSRETMEEWVQSLGLAAA